MTGPVRPSGLLQPARPQLPTPQPQPSPMQGQPSAEQQQQLLALLMMLFAGGMGQQAAPQMGAAPAPVGLPMGGMGGQ